MTASVLADLLNGAALPEGSRHTLRGEDYVVRDGILRAASLLSDAQEQTAEAFGFKWAKRDTFESDAFLAGVRAWLLERYGDVPGADWWSEYGERPLMLDAGCGAAMSALALFEPVLDRVRYVGVDISDAVDVARRRFAERALDAIFVQADVTRMPFDDASFDVIFSEGVLHHTDSTEDAFARTARLLRPNGRFLLYVYRRKGPIREFTDDVIRARLQDLSPDEAWEALMPLTKLGLALAELEVEVDVPEDIELLDIPAGRIDIQRLFYWHVVKLFHRPGHTLDEDNHVNYDWFAPRNAHRQSVKDVRRWCADAGLEIEREVAEQAGITVIARRPA